MVVVTTFLNDHPVRYHYTLSTVPLLVRELIEWEPPK